MEREIAEGWALPKVSDIIEINYGKGLIEENRNAGPVPVYGSNGVIGQHDRALTRGTTIIIGRKGSVGAVHISPIPCWPIDTTYFVHSFNEIDPQYLHYALEHLDLGQHEASTA